MQKVKFLCLTVPCLLVSVMSSVVSGANFNGSQNHLFPNDSINNTSNYTGDHNYNQYKGIKLLEEEQQQKLKALSLIYLSKVKVLDSMLEKKMEMAVSKNRQNREKINLKYIKILESIKKEYDTRSEAIDLKYNEIEKKIESEYTQDVDGIKKGNQFDKIKFIDTIYQKKCKQPLEEAWNNKKEEQEKAIGRYNTLTDKADSEWEEETNNEIKRFKKEMEEIELTKKKNEETKEKLNKNYEEQYNRMMEEYKKAKEEYNKKMSSINHTEENK